MGTSPWEEPGVYHLLAIFCVILFVFLHVRFRNPNISGLLRRLWTWLQPPMSQRQRDQQRRYEAELQKTRIRNFMHTNTLFIHLTFGLCLANFWRVVRTPTIELAFHQLLMFTGYSLHCWADGRVLSSGEFRIWTAIYCILHFMSVLTTLNETDLVMLWLSDKMVGCTMVFFKV